MEGRQDTWENLTSKRGEAVKVYSLNSATTTFSHLCTHELTVSESSERTSYITIASYDRDFAVLEKVGSGQMVREPEFREVLRVRTDFPILHCQLEHHYDGVTARYVLVGYLIDIYATTYTLDLTRAIEYTQKYPNNPHPVQFTTLANASKGVAMHENLLYLETPLLLKKTGNSIISVNLKGEVLLLDITQTKSWIKSDDFYYQREGLGQVALAAAHNRTPCKKYESVVVVATRNGRTPYVFVNCTSTTDFENQKHSQDKYEWLEDCLEVTHCAVDPDTSLVIVSTVAQTIDIYEIGDGKGSRGTFYFLRKKYGFFISNNLHFTALNIESNIENLYAGKGLLLITASKEHVIFDLVEQLTRKRMKGSNICMLKWGQVIDRRDNNASILLAKGYNHFNEQQSKKGKPSVHFKLIEFK